MALSPHAFSGHLQDKAVGLFTDSTTVTFYIYINKQWAGGRGGGSYMFLQTEWILAPQILQPPWHYWFYPMVDPFATRFNHRLEI